MPIPPCRVSHRTLASEFPQNGLGFLKIQHWEVILRQAPERPADPAARRNAILEEIINLANILYREGRDAVLPLPDDRFDLYNAIETLRGLAVVVGTITGERHRQAADAIARLLEKQR